MTTLPPKAPGSRSGPRAFSILELLVAMAILALLLTLMASMVTSVSTRWRSTFDRVDNFTKARISLEVIGRDVRRGIIQPGLANFPLEGASSAFRLVTQSLGTGDRALSVVEYRAVGPGASTDPNELGLVRTSLPVDFGDTLPFGSGELLFSQFNTAPTDDQLGPGILLFKYQFVQNDGVLRDTFTYDFEDPNSPTSCRLLVVALLVVDETALDQLEATGQLNSLINHFDSAAGPNERYRRHWMDLRQGNAFMNGMPEAVRGGIEIYERSYVLNPSL